MKYFYCYLFAFIIFILAACQREVDLKLEEVPLCQLNKGYYYYTSAGIYDSVQFTYNNGQISKAEGDLHSSSFTESGGLIRTRQLFDKIDNNRLIAVDSIQYNAGNVSSIITWNYPISSTYDTTRRVYEFSYSGAQLNMVTKYTTTFSSPITRDTVISQFTFSAGGNVETVVMRAPDGGLYNSIQYAYNGAQNYFRNVHVNFYLLDPFFTPHQDLVADLPYFISTNNVIRYSYNFTGEDLSSYLLDSNNNLEEFQIGGNSFARYTYLCP